MYLRGSAWKDLLTRIMKHEDHIAGKGMNSLSHYNLVHKFILLPQARKIPVAKAAVDKDWENLRKYRHAS